MTQNKIIIRKAESPDFKSIWPIIKRVIGEGDTYAFAPDTPMEEIQHYWMNRDKETYVALIGDGIVGTYILKDNQPGLGAHVCNGSFMVHPEMSGKGIGRALGAHALMEAKQLGYKAIQFNLVVSTNEPAVHLWKSLGFSIIGRLPEVFNHVRLGLVDAYVMHRFL